MNLESDPAAPEEEPPIANPTNDQIEQEKLHLGLLGRLWGGKNEKSSNILALLFILLLIFMGVSAAQWEHYPERIESLLGVILGYWVAKKDVT